MKTNLPVTGQERGLPVAGYLVSRTDSEGKITFANDAFVEASGFSREELLGSNHNIVRHPEVPAAVFESMWQALKSGLSWRGVLKNRCRNGDHYWVAAHVVPMHKNGEIVGYMSVCTPAEGAATAQAEAGNNYGAADHGWWKNMLSVKNGVMLGIVFVTLLMIAGGILGITGLRMSSSAMGALYYEEMVPVQTIGRISFLTADNRAQIALSLHHNPAFHGGEGLGHGLSEHLDKIDRNKKEIDSLWASYSKLPHGGREQELSDAYLEMRVRFVNDGLLPARQALAQGDYAVAEALLLKEVNPLYQEVNGRVDALLKHLSDKAESNFHEVEERNQNIATLAIVGLSAGVVLVMLSGFFFFRGTVSPLDEAVQALERITEGNLSGDCETTGCGEPGRVMHAVAIMQLHLKVMMDEIRQSSGSIHAQCHRLNHTMMNLSQHSEEQHDRVYQALDIINQAYGGLGKVANDADCIVDLIDKHCINGTARAPAANHELAAAAEAATVLAEVAAAAGQDPLLAELALADFPTAPPASERGAASASVVAVNFGAPANGQPCQVGKQQLIALAQDLAGAARIEVFAMEESTQQINQVAALIVENRAEVQGAWAASQQLEHTAQELDRLVKFFD